MGNGLKKVVGGAPLKISRSTWNSVIDAAAKAARIDPFRSGPIKADPPVPGLVLVQNDSGADVDRFAVLGIDDATVFSPADANALKEFQNRPVVSGVTPDSAVHAGRFVVVLEPIDDGKLGLGQVGGIVPCQVNVVTAGDPHAEVTDGDATKLTSGMSGSAQILSVASGTGTKWALVRLGAAVQSTSFLAKITGHTDITAQVRWKYAWTEVRIASSGTAVETFTGGRAGTTGSPSGSDLGFALNLVEMNNPAWDGVGGDGVNPAGAAYPAGFSRRPIGSAGTADTHTNDVIVRMWLEQDAGGVQRAVFSQVNAHDGTCT